MVTARRIQRTTSTPKYIIVLILRFITVKRYKAKSAKGKGHASED